MGAGSRRRDEKGVCVGHRQQGADRKGVGFIVALAVPGVGCDLEPIAEALPPEGVAAVPGLPRQDVDAGAQVFEIDLPGQEVVGLKADA